MVLLPLPDAPTMAQLVPAGTRSDTPCRTQQKEVQTMGQVEVLMQPVPEARVKFAMCQDKGQDAGGKPSGDIAFGH